MRKFFFLLPMALLLVQACSSSDSTSNIPLTVEAVQNIATSGPWKVTYLATVGGEVKTNEYQGYSFTFNQINNSTTSNNVNDNFQGTWFVANPIENQLYFSLDFQEALNIYSIDAYWRLIEIKNNKIVLKISTNNEDISSWYYNLSSDPSIYPTDLIFEKI